MRIKHVFATMLLVNLLFWSTTIFATIDVPMESSWGTGSVCVTMGQKLLHKSNWGNLHTQIAYGVQANYGGREWPLYGVTGWQWSQGSKVKNGVRATGETGEWSLGIGKGWELPGRVRLSGALGGSLVSAGIEVESGVNRVNDSAIGFGVWEEAGIKWGVIDRMDLGVKVRHSYSRVQLFGEPGDAGGIMYGATIGCRF